jgi:hypothetical protein
MDGSRNAGIACPLQLPLHHGIVLERDVDQRLLQSHAAISLAPQSSVLQPQPATGPCQQQQQVITFQMPLLAPLFFFLPLGPRGRLPPGSSGGLSHSSPCLRRHGVDQQEVSETSEWSEAATRSGRESTPRAERKKKEERRQQRRLERDHLLLLLARASRRLRLKNRALRRARDRCVRLEKALVHITLKYDTMVERELEWARNPSIPSVTRPLLVLVRLVHRPKGQIKA